MDRPLLLARVLVGASQLSLAHGASALDSASAVRVPLEYFPCTMPVMVKQFPGGPLRVICRVMEGWDPGQHTVGTGEAPVPLTATGDFSGNVVVKIWNVRGGDPSKANIYACSLAGSDNSDLSHKAKAGAPFTVSVSGPITK